MTAARSARRRRGFGLLVLLASACLSNVEDYATQVSRLERTEYLSVFGIVTEGNIEHLTLRRPALAAPPRETPNQGPWQLRLVAEGGQELLARRFELAGMRADVENAGFFAEVVTFPEVTARLELWKDGTLVRSVLRSQSAPVVRLVSPSGGGSLSGSAVVTWEVDAADDADSLRFDLAYSPDQGQTWRALGVDLLGRSFVWDTTLSAGSERALVRVQANDGLNVARDESDQPFAVERKPPVVTIAAPSDNSRYFLGELVLFEGNTTDPEDGPLEAEALSWQVDGSTLATGNSASSTSLPAGEHVITLRATDSDGMSSEASIRVHVENSADSDGDGRGDDTDNCPFDHNPGQENADADGPGDACSDGDSDGYIGRQDNCPALPNDQEDRDEDRIGDACDAALVDRNPPLLTLPSDITAEAQGPWGAQIFFEASADDVFDARAVAVICVPPSNARFPLGTTVTQCSATDAAGHVAQGEFSVTVQDTSPPVISAVSGSPDKLWPPNGKMVNVSIRVTATDLASEPVCRAISVSSSEPDCPGTPADDWRVVGPSQVELRAERCSRPGRTYSVSVECRDQAGNSSTSAVGVIVPHDSRK